MVIALAGKKLSGKGTAAEYIKRNHAAVVMRFSAILQDILRRLHQPYTRDQLVRLGTMLRELYGNDMLARVIHDDIMETLPTGDRIMVIDGMRYISEYETLRSLPGFTLWYIDATLDNRFARTKLRQEKSDESEMTVAEFMKRESDPTEQGIADLERVANRTIENNGTIEEFYQRIAAAISTTSEQL